jgi:catechol 2,3-dioxygenase-like lactoylglutathione lyase family enzyme
MKMHHAAVVCSSQENADRFYHEILGLKKIKNSILNKHLAEKIFDIALECQFSLYGNENFSVEVFVAESDPGKSSPFVHLCLEVEDRETFLKMCQSRGLAVTRTPKGDSLLTFLRDYDGNLFEIKESAG